MKNNLKNLTLAAMALAIAPLAHAQTVTLFDSNTTGWSGESSLSATSGGASTFSIPALVIPGGPNNNLTDYAVGEDFFSLPSSIASGSVYTFQTTVTTNIPQGDAGINFSVGFGNLNTTSTFETSGGGTANNTGGPWIADVRSGAPEPGTGVVTWGSVLHGGLGSTPPSAASYVAPGGILSLESDQTAPLTLKLVLDTTNPLWTVTDILMVLRLSLTPTLPIRRLMPSELARRVLSRMPRRSRSRTRR